MTAGRNKMRFTTRKGLPAKPPEDPYRSKERGKQPIVKEQTLVSLPDGKILAQPQNTWDKERVGLLHKLLTTCVHLKMCVQYSCTSTVSISDLSFTITDHHRSPVLERDAMWINNEGLQAYPSPWMKVAIEVQKTLATQEHELNRPAKLSHLPSAGGRAMLRVF